MLAENVKAAWKAEYKNTFMTSSACLMLGECSPALQRHS
ncbi:hypothetical protein Tco_0895052, partial [Tanacetum coccineum]